MKILIISFLIIICSCVNTYRKTETIIVDKYKYVENWNKNGIKIIKIDTLHTVIGDKYKVKYQY